MPLFTLHRNYVLRTTKGCVIRFKKDTATHVPPVAVHDAVAIGARQIDGEKVENLDDQTPEPTPMSPDERKAKVFEAFATMKKRADRLDFTGTGTPNAKRIPPLTGFEITSKERDVYWKEFHAIELEAREQADLDAASEASD